MERKAKQMLYSKGHLPLGNSNFFFQIFFLNTSIDFLILETLIFFQQFCSRN